jgi:hypothetical protein
MYPREKNNEGAQKAGSRWLAAYVFLLFAKKVMLAVGGNESVGISVYPGGTYIISTITTYYG